MTYAIEIDPAKVERAREWVRPGHGIYSAELVERVVRSASTDDPERIDRIYQTSTYADAYVALGLSEDQPHHLGLLLAYHGLRLNKVVSGPRERSTAKHGYLRTALKSVRRVIGADGQPLTGDALLAAVARIDSRKGVS